MSKPSFRRTEDFGGPLAPDLDHPGEGHEKIHDFGGVGGDHQEIHVPDGLFQAPHRAGGVGPLHFRQALQLLKDLIGNGQNFPQQKPAFAALQEFDGLQDVLFGLFAEAEQGGNLVGLGCGFQFFQGLDAQLFE